MLLCPFGWLRSGACGPRLPRRGLALLPPPRSHWLSRGPAGPRCDVIGGGGRHSGPGRGSGPHLGPCAWRCPGRAGALTGRCRLVLFEIPAAVVSLSSLTCPVPTASRLSLPINPALLPVKGCAPLNPVGGRVRVLAERCPGVPAAPRPRERLGALWESRGSAGAARGAVTDRGRRTPARARLPGLRPHRCPGLGRWRPSGVVSGAPTDC